MSKFFEKYPKVSGTGVGATVGATATVGALALMGKISMNAYVAVGLGVSLCVISSVLAVLAMVNLISSQSREKSAPTKEKDATSAEPEGLDKKSHLGALIGGVLMASGVGIAVSNLQHALTIGISTILAGFVVSLITVLCSLECEPLPTYPGYEPLLHQQASK